MSVGLQRLREEPDAIREGAIRKGEDPALVDRALAPTPSAAALLGEGETLKAERNAASKRIGEAIKAGAAPDGPEVAELRAASTAAGERIAAIDEELADDRGRGRRPAPAHPQPARPGHPDRWRGGQRHDPGLGRAAAHEGRSTARSARTRRPAARRWRRKPHWELGEALGIIDNARGAKITGSGFPVYKGAGSALQRALINWFLDVHARENGMTEVWPPAVVKRRCATGTGQIPDKEDQMYVVTRDDLYLIPTAEVPVTNLHRDEILEAADLPIRYAAYTPCFRREAGAAGKDTRGILRVHQFDKVEMVLFERPEESAAALEWMTGRAEILLQRLGLAYRVLLMWTREMGFTQARKYDLEVWSPGVERWLEVSSCSNFRDFQARRMAIRYRPEPGAKPELVHTLNGSGLALARVVAAHPRDLPAAGRHDRRPRGAPGLHGARYHRLKRDRLTAATAHGDAEPTAGRRHLRRPRPAAPPAVAWESPERTTDPRPVSSSRRTAAAWSPTSSTGSSHGGLRGSRHHRHDFALASGSTTVDNKVTARSGAVTGFVLLPSSRSSSECCTSRSSGRAAVRPRDAPVRPARRARQGRRPDRLGDGVPPADRPVGRRCGLLHRLHLDLHRQAPPWLAGPHRWDDRHQAALTLTRGERA